MAYDTTELMLQNQKAIMSALSHLIYACSPITTARVTIQTDLTKQITRTLLNLERREETRRRNEEPKCPQ